MIQVASRIAESGFPFTFCGFIRFTFRAVHLILLVFKLASKNIGEILQEVIAFCNQEIKLLIPLLLNMVSKLTLPPGPIKYSSSQAANNFV